MSSCIIFIISYSITRVVAAHMAMENYLLLTVVNGKYIYYTSTVLKYNFKEA